VLVDVEVRMQPLQQIGLQHPRSSSPTRSRFPATSARCCGRSTRAAATA
jgi:hypothetical protein